MNQDNKRAWSTGEARGSRRALWRIASSKDVPREDWTDRAEPRPLVLCRVGTERMAPDCEASEMTQRKNSKVLSVGDRRPVRKLPAGANSRRLGVPVGLQQLQDRDGGRPFSGETCSARWMAQPVWQSYHEFLWSPRSLRGISRQSPWILIPRRRRAPKEGNGSTHRGSDEQRRALNKY